jgi:hypothetical protein
MKDESDLEVSLLIGADIAEHPLRIGLTWKGRKYL